MTYSAVANSQEHLELRYATYEDPELVREQARQWAERLVMGRVGYAVIYAQAKLKKALEPESLSLAADGWRDAVSNVYRSMSRRFGMSRPSDEADEELASVA